MLTKEQNSGIVITMQKLIVFDIDNRSREILQVDHYARQYCTTITVTLNKFMYLVS